MTKLAPVDVERVESLHRLARDSADSAVRYAIECGQELLRVKQEIGHGNFGRWCQGLSFAWAQANRYMRVARQIDLGKINLEGTDSLNALLKLAGAERKADKREGVIDAADLASVKTADLAALSSRGMRFGTIYADPPWLYGNQGTRGSTGDHYAGLTIDEIAALPIAALAADSAHLHLWTTNAFLFDSKRIIEAWGFEYRSCFVWVKPQIGMGNYWRVSHEFLLLGIRGSCPFTDHSLRSWGEFRRGKHSAKPDQIRSLIERASPGPRLELFGRLPAPGWVVWGNEIARTVFDESVEELAA